MYSGSSPSDGQKRSRTPTASSGGSCDVSAPPRPEWNQSPSVSPSPTSQDPNHGMGCPKSEVCSCQMIFNVGMVQVSVKFGRRFSENALGPSMESFMPCRFCSIAAPNCCAINGSM